MFYLFKLSISQSVYNPLADLQAIIRFTLTLRVYLLAFLVNINFLWAQICLNITT